MSAPDWSLSVWRKSTRSHGNTNCVEVAVCCDIIGVRDSKDPGGAVLGFTERDWRTFTDTIKRSGRL
ncbi:DUF397 domain-containing protein [Actinomadura graeca]|uniref:DUF397 domain-containing protein n=1 Tax=Actinomadura graeca TaxID=2750812 RepID=A0ABX8R249_9ACTN|nr:DUF397 domain-containing protein [Actinomadura graeca]QXJ23078.1 DUF397 domain-containing protein [Actinomadura graeca]